MSFLDDLTGANGTGSNLADRMGNTAANTAKDVSDATLQKFLASESDPTKRAAAILANAGAQAVIDKMAGKDKRKIPDPYAGMGKMGITMPSKDYIVTPEHTLNTYFAQTMAGDTSYNDAHPMFSSLFLVDFKFNQRVVSNYPRNELFPLLGRAFPLSMSFLLKSMSFPKVSFETVKLNQYNKYVTRPKKMVYDPVSMSFNEIYSSLNSTTKNRVSLMTFMKEYLSYYSNDITKSGYNLQNGLSGDRKHFNLIDSIDVYFFWNSGAKKISMVNPFIDNFAYSDLSYEEDNILSLTCNVQYEYLDMYDIDITLKEFIDTASHLLADVDNGHTPQPLKVGDNQLDIDALQPIKSTGDSQRNIGLDNPVAAMAVALAETAMLNKFANNLTDPDPMKRAVAKGALNAASDGSATVANAASNSVSAITKGLF